MARAELRAAAAGEIARWERQFIDALIRLLERQEGVVLARLQGTKARKNTRHWNPPGELKVDPTYVLDPTRWTLDAAGSVEPVLRRLYADTYDSVATRVAGPPPPPPPPDQPAEPIQPTPSQIGPSAPPTSPPVPSTVDGGGLAGPLLAAALVAAVLASGGDDDAHPALGALAHVVGALRDRRRAGIEAAVQRRLADVAAAANAFGAGVQQAIADAEAAAAAMPDIVKAVRAIYDGQKKDWAEKVAASSVPSAVNEASHLAVSDVAEALTATAETGGEPPRIFKQWLSSHDDRVRATHAHADGQTVPLADRFRLGGIDAQPIVSWALFPGDPTLPPGERINCRCTMLFSRPALIETKGFDPNQPRAHDGKWSKVPGLGALKPDEHGRDTLASVFGMHYSPSHADREDVKRAKAWTGWGSLPSRPWDIGGSSTPLATEERLDSRPIKKVLAGAPLRKGYDPQILRTDDGEFLIDGHHRMAMHLALGHETIPAKVLDVRSAKGGFDGALAALEARRVTWEKDEAERIADSMVTKAEKSDPIITPIISDTVTELGGAMDGLQNRIKTRESTARKILTRAHMKHTTPSGASAGVSDVLRYTAVLPTASYADGVKATLGALRKAGFSPTISNNYWARGDAYSGLNILLSGKGQSLEVQFHTPESLHAKGLAHDDYEVCRDDSAPLWERMAAWDRMVPLWDAVPQPEGWWELGSLFVYDPPGKGRGHYISKWAAQGLPEPPKPAPTTNPHSRHHWWGKPKGSLVPPWSGKGGGFPWSNKPKDH